jgi:hypothetical protein
MSWETYLSHRRRGRCPIHNAKNGYNTPLIRRLATTHYNNNDTRASPKLNHKPRHDQRQATPKKWPPPNSPRQRTSYPRAPKSRQAGGRTWPARERCHLGVADDGVHCALEAQPWAVATPERHRARTVCSTSTCPEKRCFQERNDVGDAATADRPARSGFSPRRHHLE